MRKIDISVIIPVYNVEMYIEKCINSIIQQSYRGNIECLIIDDCGKDNSINIINQIINKYHGNIKFHIISHQQNQGLSAARNTGILNANYEYLYFIDSDDWITLDCLEKLANLANKYPEAEIIQAGTISPNQWLDIETKKLPEYSENRQWIKSTFLKRSIIPLTVWNKLIKKKFITDNNLFFRIGYIHEDEIWNFYMIKHIQKIAFMKENTYNYVIREGSIMHSNNSLSLMTWIKIMDEFIDNIDKICYYEQRVFIFNYLIDKFLETSTEQRNKYYLLLNKLFKKCNILCIWGKLLLCLPHKYQIYGPITALIYKYFYFTLKF